MPTRHSSLLAVTESRAHQAGQSVIEVLVSTAVVAVVMTGIAAGLTLSVRNTSEAKMRAYASGQGQQVMEVFRRERIGNGWQTFKGAVSTGDYCFNTLPTSLSGFDSLYGKCDVGVPAMGTEFKHDVEVIVAPDSVKVNVVVSWVDGARRPSITLSQELRAYAGE